MEAVDFTITTDIFDLEVEHRSQPTPPHNGTARGTPQIETYVSLRNFVTGEDVSRAVLTQGIKYTLVGDHSQLFNRC